MEIMAKVGNLEQKQATRSLDVVYEDLWTAGKIEEWTQEHVTTETRGPLALIDLIADLGLSTTSRLIDVGCGRGDYACTLAKRFACSVVAVDPVESNLERTRQLVQAEGLTQLVCVEKAALETLPFASGSFSLVWCRSVIVHLPDLAAAFQACRRLLQTGGYMMLQTGYATNHMSPNEITDLCRRLGFYKQSLLQETVESALATNGFTVVKSDSFGSEHAEFYEQYDGRCAKYLTGIARLLRAEEQVVAQFGRAAYETALGMYHWQLYQMLGKISYHAYLLQAN